MSDVQDLTDVKLTANKAYDEARSDEKAVPSPNHPSPRPLPATHPLDAVVSEGDR